MRTLSGLIHRSIFSCLLRNIAEDGGLAFIFIFITFIRYNVILYLSKYIGIVCYALFCIAFIILNAAIWKTVGVIYLLINRVSYRSVIITIADF